MRFPLRQALLTARQEKEIQLKMLITRGESVQRNTSAEGVPAVQKQIQELKDSWDALLSASIQCKRSGSDDARNVVANEIEQRRCSGMHGSRCFLCTLLSGIGVFYQFNSQLEGSLSQWTSYQEDSRQFVAWMERVEESLDPTDKQCPEMRDKTAHLSKVKVSGFFSVALRVSPCCIDAQVQCITVRDASASFSCSTKKC